MIRPFVLLPLLLFSAAVSFGQTKPVESMRGVNRGQPRPSVAVLLVGANDMIGGIVEPGWPLIVSAVRLPDEKTASVPLPANLALKLTGETGTIKTIAFEPLPRPTMAENAVALYWQATEAGTRGLSTGRYRVTLAPAQGEYPGWRMEAGEFEVVAPNPERSRLLGHLKIHRSALLGRSDDALAEADRLIAANANDKEAWIAKGDVLMLKDQPAEALQAFDRALRLHPKTEREPVAIQTRRRAAFFRSLEKRSVTSPKPAP